MEIERKFLIDKLPDNLQSFPCLQIEQGYLCTEPVVRIRRQNQEYYLTYKSAGLMVREEYNLSLTKDAYEHLRTKADGRIISKKRYLIPFGQGFTIELDVFQGSLAPLLLAEVEFSTEEKANAFLPPDWFGEDVTYSNTYHNSSLSKADGVVSPPQRQAADGIVSPPQRQAADGIVSPPHKPTLNNENIYNSENN